MPPVVSAIVTVFGTIGGYAAAGLIAIGVPTGIAIGIGTTLAYGLLMSPLIAYQSSQKRKMQKAMAASHQAGVDQGRSVMSRDPVAPRQIVYGQVLKSGSISFMEVGGSSNEYLYLNIDIADHLCEELGTVYFDKQALTLDGSGNITSPAKYVGYGRVLKFLGLVAGERDTVLEGELPSSWTANHLGKEVARLHVRLKHNPEAFTNGIPLVEVMVKGRKLYDFRTATTVWSANSALCVSDFLMDSRFGKGVAQARIISADVIEAANICDENVTLNPSGTEDRYTTNGVVNGSQDPDSVLAELESAMAGTVSDPGGKWSIRAGAHRTPTITFTDDDFASTAPFSMTPRQSRQDTFNGVRGQFIGPINEWAPADFPVITNATYMGWDGGIRLWKDVVYNFTTSYATAQRLAKIDLERGRQQIVVQADFKLKAIQCQPGDVVMLTRANLGWSSKLFEVLDWSLKITDSGGGPVIVVSMTLKETAAAVWDWANGEETVVDAAPNTNLWDAAAVATPGTPTLSTVNFVQGDGTISPRLRVQWSAPSDEFITNGGYTQIEYKKTADGTWLIWSEGIRGNATEDHITDVLAGVSYDVRIKFENVRGVRGAYSPTATATVALDNGAPSAPTSLAAVAQSTGIYLTWVNPSDDDLLGIEVFENTTNNSGTATALGIQSTTGYLRAGLAAGAGRYYWVKAVDTTGNRSSFTSSVFAIALDPNGSNFTLQTTNATDLGGGNVMKTAGTNGAWDAQGYSNEFFTGACYCTFRGDATAYCYLMGGLDANPSADANYPIDYAWHLDASGAGAYVYKNGTVVGSTHGTYTSATVFSIVYDGSNMFWYMDGVLKYSEASAANQKLAFDSSLTNIDASGATTIYDIRFGPMSAATVTHKLALSSLAVNQDTGGVFYPSTVTASATSKSGTGSPAAYSGRFKIYENGSGAASYTSAGDESSKVYTPSSSAVTSMKFELYLAGGTSTLLDSITVPVTYDGDTGATGPDGADGATVLGVASGASTVNGTSPVSVSALLLASLSIPAGTRLITYNGVLSNSSGSTNVVRCAIYAAGSAIKTSEEYTLTAGQGVAVTLFVTETPGAGTRTYQMYGWSSTGSAYDLVVGGELIVQ